MSKKITCFSFLSLLSISCIYLYFNCNMFATPWEDAAMLMRYVENILNGHGIVWNTDEPPVDGVTDFLFLVMVVGLSKLGVSVELSVRILGILTHVLTILLVYYATVKIWKMPLWLGWFNALLLLFGPGIAYIEAGFGTTVFTFAVSISWLIALLAITEENRKKYFLLFAISSLVMGLIRPEGVILASFILISLIGYLGIEKSKPLLKYFITTFGVFGGAYFLWRWSYFGYPLPNPFYIKGGGELYLDGLKSSIFGIIRFVLPFSLIFLFGLILLFRKTVFLILPIVLFTGIWVLLSDAMNYYARFQYPMLPMILLAYPIPLNEIKKYFIKYFNDKKWIKPILFTILSAGMISVLVRQYKNYLPTSYNWESRIEISNILTAYKEEGYSMAVTEAGLLPYYSKWKTIDTWGLNNSWIAHNGLTEDYLDIYKPEIIFFHKVKIESSSLPGWKKLTNLLETYAENRNYCLAINIKFKDHDNRLIFYVKRDFVHSSEIFNKLRQVKYQSPSGGECINTVLKDQELCL